MQQLAAELLIRPIEIAVPLIIGVIVYSVFAELDRPICTKFKEVTGHSSKLLE